MPNETKNTATASTQPTDAQSTSAPETAGQTTVDPLLELQQTQKKKKQPNKRRRKLIGRIIWSVVLVAFLIGLGIAVWKIFLTPDAVYYETAWITRGSLENTAQGYGYVRAADSADIAVKQSGKVLESKLVTGDIVQAGDLLFVIDPSEIDKTIADLQKEIDDLVTQNVEYQSEIAKKISETSVRAPFAGKLINMKEDTTINLGDVLDDNTTLGLLVDDAVMLLTLYYSYAYENMISPGMSAQISIPSSMSLVEGTVSRVDKVRKITPEGTVLFEVEFKITNPGALSKDMMATALMTGSSGEDIIPSEAGKLRYSQEQTLTLGTGGKVSVFNMHEYYTYPSGTLFCQVEYSPDMARIEANNETIAKKMENIATETEKYESLTVVAPIGGTVMYNKLIEGEVADPGQAVISLAQLDNMVIEAQIDERNIGGVEVGQTVMLEQWTDSGTQTFSGTVDTVSLEATNENGYVYFPAIIKADNYDGTLRPNMSVNFTISLTSVNDVLVAPVNAIKLTAVGEIAFVKTDTPPENVVELPAEITIPTGFYPVSVVTGMGTTMGIEIVSGLEEGAEVYTQDLDYDPNSMDNGGMDGNMGGRAMSVSVG